MGSSLSSFVIGTFVRRVSQQAFFGQLRLQELVGAADSERRNCYGVCGVLSAVPEALSAAAARKLQ